MQVVIRDTKQDTINLAAAIMARELKARPNLVLGLATGRTMEGLYARFVEMLSGKGWIFPWR